MKIFLLFSFWVGLVFWAICSASADKKEKDGRKRRNTPEKPRPGSREQLLALQQERERRQKQAVQREIDRLRREKRKAQQQKKKSGLFCRV